MPNHRWGPIQHHLQGWSGWARSAHRHLVGSIKATAIISHIKRTSCAFAVLHQVCDEPNSQTHRHFLGTIKCGIERTRSFQMWGFLRSYPDYLPIKWFTIIYTSHDLPILDSENVVTVNIRLSVIESIESRERIKLGMKDLCTSSGCANESAWWNKIAANECRIEKALLHTMKERNLRILRPSDRTKLKLDEEETFKPQISKSEIEKFCFLRLSPGRK